jgi:ABC-type multidrug transport system fused ATPase/permease subunit
VAPLVTGLITLFGRRIRKSARRRQESQAYVTQRLVQILAGIKVIKAFRTQAVEETAFQDENLRYFRRNMKVVKNRTLARTSVEGLNNGIGIAIILLGAALVMNRMWGLTLGSLAAFVLVMQATYRPMKDLAKGWTHLMEAAPSAERFFELMDAEPDVADIPGAVRLEGVREGIKISEVSFSYGREPVLRNLSLEVSAGEVVAIVGPTGAGKTTLTDLLLRFYDPDAGSIAIDGVDLRRIERSSLLAHIAVVTQEPFLFAGSIWDNLRYGRPDAGDAEIEAAARAARVDEFAETLPRRYETDVGDAGAMLSGGQRQRITIGRAILKDPAILIFDEATSALDAKSERYVHEAIDALLSGRTVFIVAHRLSTIRHADKIAVLKKGSIVGLGTHEELMASSCRSRAKSARKRPWRTRAPRDTSPGLGDADAAGLAVIPQPRASRYRAVTSSAKREGAKTVSARLRAFSPMVRRLTGSSRRARHALASASGSSSQRTPVTPSTTISGRAPRFEVTAGIPQAAASSSPSLPGTRKVKTSMARSTSV